MGPDVHANTITYVCGVLFWLLLVGVSWHIVFPRWTVTRTKWSHLDQSDRYYLCSLVNSTVHGILVPIGVLICFAECQIWGDFLSATCTPIEMVFAVVASYFTIDTIFLLIFPDKTFQTIYLVHHAIGSMPYFLNAFFTPNVHFLVGFGICVELTNPLINALSAVTLFGHEETDLGKKLVWCCWIAWIPTRICMPAYLFWGMTTITIPTLGVEPWALIFSYITGIFVTFFCLAVFGTHLTPKCLAACRAKPKAH